MNSPHTVFWPVVLCWDFDDCQAKICTANDYEGIKSPDGIPILGTRSLDTDQVLENIVWKDIYNLKSIGIFLGCNNTVYALDPDQEIRLTNLNKSRAEEKEKKALLYKLKEAKRILNCSLFSKWDAKKYNNLHNEGGSGYVPEFVTQDMKERAQKLLEAHPKEVEKLKLKYNETRELPWWKRIIRDAVIVVRRK